VAGVGWRGPNWQEAERTEQTMKATTTAIEAFRQRTRHGRRARELLTSFNDLLNGFEVSRDRP
jgi:hypothetical protein